MSEDPVVFEGEGEGAAEVFEIDTEGRTVVPLLWPVTVTYRTQGRADRIEEVAELRLRRPTGADLMALEKAPGNAAQARLLITRLAGCSEAVFDRMDAADIERLSGAIEGFFPTGRATGRRR